MSLNPKWDESFTFDIKHPESDILVLKLYDYDLLSAHDFLGQVCISIQRILKKKNYETWFDLAQCDHGKILLHLEVLDDENNRLNVQKEEKILQIDKDVLKEGMGQGISPECVPILGFRKNRNSEKFNNQ